MKIMTYYNAVEKSERLVEVYEQLVNQPDSNLRKSTWGKMLHALKQGHKFREKLIALILEADIAKEKISNESKTN